MGLRKSSYTKKEFHEGQHRFEHWYRDNSVYFITSRVSDKSPAFQSEEAKQVFWSRFDHYARRYGFQPWVCSLLDNHYHLLGFLSVGANLGPFMQHLHGAVAKLVNDLLAERVVPFWRTKGKKDYFDGCLRDEVQLERTHRYVRLQAVRAGLVRDYRDYGHTIVHVDIEQALRFASERKAYLPEVPYARYEGRGSLKRPRRG